MKLITEYLPDTTNVVTEEVDGKKKLYIEGIFMQAAKKNRNGRMYPTSVLESAVNKYITEEVETNGAIGELNHPTNPIPDPNNASHRIIELRKEGNDFYGKALILNTPQGQKVAGLLEGEVRLGVSSRGLGTVKEVKGVNEVQKDFQLKTVDIVHNPSAPDAFINGIMEGVDYMTDGSMLDPNHVDRIEQEIKAAPSIDLHAVKLRLFKEAMAEISGETSLNELNLPFKLDLFQKDWLKKALKSPSQAEADIRAMVKQLSNMSKVAPKGQQKYYTNEISKWNALLASVMNA